MKATPRPAPGDLDSAWSVTVPDEDVADLSGVVTGEMQDLLPGFALCPDASEKAQTTATALEWDAFMELELVPDLGDSVEPYFAIDDIGAIAPVAVDKL